MEPAWEELTEAFANSKSKLIGEIDCTTDQGKPLCMDMGVNSYPTLKWGNIYNLQEYEGPREYDSLKAFSDKHLKPTCGADHVQLCDKATRQELRRLKKLSLHELDTELYAKTEELNLIEKDSKQFIDDLEEHYAKAKEMKEKGQKKIIDSGLALMKVCAQERGLELGGGAEDGKAEDEAM